MEREITKQSVELFEKFLWENERAETTIRKYVRDVTHFMSFAGGRMVEKELVLDYKAKLEKKFAVTSANSMLAAINALFRFLGWGELCVKQFRVQKQAFCSVEKELTKGEYLCLVREAEHNGNKRLHLLLQTICSTGIRVGELQYITLDAVKKGEAIVSSKGKRRTIFITSSLRTKLVAFAKERGIGGGPIFVTKTGKPMNRSNIWREMKKLCQQAGVAMEKVFPHNLRHLFARTFYALEKDIAKLADILGHTSINTTRIYIITTGEEHKRKMEMMKLVI